LRKEGGWIVIADDESEPIFQGKLFTVTDDSFGLAIGVLMEEGQNTELLKDLKAERIVEHLGPGQILAKAIIDFDTYIVMSELTDTELRQSIQDVIHSGREIDVKLMLNSREIQFVNGSEDNEKYSEIWGKMSPAPIGLVGVQPLNEVRSAEA